MKIQYVQHGLYDIYRDGEGWSMRVALDELENHLSALGAEVAA